MQTSTVQKRQKKKSKKIPNGTYKTEKNEIKL